MGSLKGSQADCYDSPFAAEVYDLQEPVPGFYRDIDLLWRAIQVIEKSRATKAESISPSDPLVIVDIGCGTGRVLQGIEQKAQQSQPCLFPPECATFIGIDPAQPMIDRATRASPNGAHFGNVSWICASGVDLPGVLDGRKVDLAIIAVSTFCLFTEPGEGELVLLHLARALRPVTGRVSLSVVFRDALLRDDFSNPIVQEIRSQDFPNITYRSNLAVSKVEENILFHSHQVAVIREGTGGIEPETERIIDAIARTRLWTEDEFLAAVETAGLFVVDTDRNGLDCIFTLAAK